MALFSDSGKMDGLAILLGVFAICYLLIKRTFSYWDRKGFKTLPNFNYLFGHFSPMLLSNRLSLTDFVATLYEKTKDPFIGVYGIGRPMLLARSPALVRSILVKDSAHFLSRGFHTNDNFDPMLGQCFALPVGNKWKEVRGKLSIAFTPNKLKAVFPILIENGAKLQNYLRKSVSNGDMINIHEIAARYATNTITAAAFGIDVNTISNPENDFRKYGRKIFEPTFSQRARLIMGLNAPPSMMNLLGGTAIDNETKDFIKSFVKENTDYRAQNDVNRNDLFKQIMQLNTIDKTTERLETGTSTVRAMTDDEIAAQALLFLAAGFEQAAITITFCLFELAKKQAIQKRIQDEVAKVLQEHNGTFTYESMADMKYLDACIDETLRKYPPVPVISRKCLKDYQIPGTDNIIEKGTDIILPTLSMHRDAEYYENPNEFIPDRFMDEQLAANNRAYFPFGDGPRSCIGMRLGKMQTKIGLAMMLQNFKYDLNDELKHCELEFASENLLLFPNRDILLYISKC